MANRTIYPPLTAARLREVLNYNEKTGKWRWIKKTKPGSPNEVGNVGVWGYRIIGIDGKTYRSSRLAVLWMTGQWPQGDVDHKNGNTLDDRWKNLQDGTTSQNMRNHRLFSTNRSGINGVHWDRCVGRWRVYLWGKYLGICDTKEQAKMILRRANTRVITR